MNDAPSPSSQGSEGVKGLIDSHSQAKASYEGKRGRHPAGCVCSTCAGGPSRRGGVAVQAAPSAGISKIPEQALQEVFKSAGALGFNLAAAFGDDEAWNLNSTQRDEVGNILYHMLADDYNRVGPGKKYFTGGLLLCAVIGLKARETAPRRAARRLARENAGKGIGQPQAKPSYPQPSVNHPAAPTSAAAPPDPRPQPPAPPSPGALAILPKLPEKPLG